MLTNKYVTVKGIGGISSHDLRLGDFKSVLAVRDPKDDMEHEIMCAFFVTMDATLIRKNV